MGKSSLAQAGVIAALKRQEWPTGGAWPAALTDSRSWLPLTIRPEDKPLKSLALTFTRLLYELSADQDEDAEGWVQRFRDGAGFGDLMRAVKERLAQSLGCDAPQSFFLYIDQAEELYASTEREGKPDAAAKRDAETFSRLIAEAAGRADCRVMLSLGSGYLNSLDADEALSAVSQVVYVPPMTSDALQQAIERPAVAFGVRFVPDEMPSIIACSIANQAGALPHLGYLLSQAWRQMQERNDGVMRFDEPPKDFDVSATLRERVECYCAEGKAQERDLERLFTLHLTLVLRRGYVIKRRARRAECSANEWNIAEELAEAKWRLVTLEKDVAEVAHEQLLRSWPTLDGWLKRRWEFLIFKSYLEEERKFYDETPASAKTSALLTGRRLEVARDLLKMQADDLAPEERKFISDSVVEEKKQIEDRRQEKKARARTEVATVAGVAGMSALTALALEHLFGISWHDLLSYGPFAIVSLVLLVFLIVLLLFLPQTYQIADWLTLAEREMNSLLRAWGGGYESRKNAVKEHADWLSMIPVTDDPAPFAEVYKNFFDLNQEELKSGGPQGAAMGKVRMTAFLLRELYEGNVKNAQLKIFNEFANGNKPYIAPSIRQIVGYDKFDVNDVKNSGFAPGAGVDWFPLWLTVILNRFPRNIIMVRSDKTVACNRAVIDELATQLIPKASSGVKGTGV